MAYFSNCSKSALMAITEEFHFQCIFPIHFIKRKLYMPVQLIEQERANYRNRTDDPFITNEMLYQLS
jgi:hypothetical protein